MVKKTAVVDGFRPQNTLRNSRPGLSHFTASSPAKEATIQAGPPASEPDTHANTQVQRSPGRPRRKRSHESISTTRSDSLPCRATKSVTTPGQPKIEEYRNLDKKMKPSKRQRVRRDKSWASQTSSPGFTPARALLNSDHESTSDLDMDQDSKTTKDIGSNMEWEPSEKQPTTKYQSLPRPHLKFQDAMHRSRIGPTKIRSKEIKEDDSADELALPSYSNGRGITSSSLSTRGDIRPTRFKARSAPTDPTSSAQDSWSVEEAQERIGFSLKIKSAASGPYSYSSEDQDCAIFLGVRDQSHILLPMDRNMAYLKDRRYLTTDRSKLQVVLMSEASDCAIVTVQRPFEAALGIHAKLTLELSSKKDVDIFKQWATDGNRTIPVKLKYTDSEKLSKQLQTGFDEAKQRNARTNAGQSHGHESDDVQMIQHYADARDQQHEKQADSNMNRPAKPKAKERMNAENRTLATADDQVYEVFGTTNQRRATRSDKFTRSTFQVPSATSSPDQEMTFDFGPGWTELNREWRANWRNSLVFPPMGKHRATVDAADIERLNEGQYLNDNLIIFYLRYLQYRLENERPKLADRVYFQNTFFFDKLKPQRTSAEINYDSVRSWTSKVDIFSKDFIIVPINEYSHWYVAIIYNAPKLVPRPSPQPEEAVPSGPSVGQSEEQHIDQVSGHDDNATSDRNNESLLEIFWKTSLRRVFSPDSKKTNSRVDDPGNKEAERGHEAVRPTQDTTMGLDENSTKGEKRTHKPAGVQTPSSANKKKIGGARQLDPELPRIVTLDSLGAGHSPACTHLKHYLVQEMRDKKQIVIDPPTSLGMTVKNAPKQTNHCDCGLYLLGYIEEFLKDPDSCMGTMLRRDDLNWDLNPPALRDDIRKLIFDLQDKQKKQEDEDKQRKRQQRSQKAQGAPVGGSVNDDALKPAAKKHHDPQEDIPQQSIERSYDSQATTSRPIVGQISGLKEEASRSATAQALGLKEDEPEDPITRKAQEENKSSSKRVRDVSAILRLTDQSKPPQNEMGVVQTSREPSDASSKASDPSKKLIDGVKPTQDNSRSTSSSHTHEGGPSSKADVTPPQSKKSRPLSPRAVSSPRQETTGPRSLISSKKDGSGLSPSDDLAQPTNNNTTASLTLKDEDVKNQTKPLERLSVGKGEPRYTSSFFTTQQSPSRNLRRSAPIEISDSE